MKPLRVLIREVTWSELLFERLPLLLCREQPVRCPLQGLVA